METMAYQQDSLCSSLAQVQEDKIHSGQLQKLSWLENSMPHGSQ